MLGIFPKTNINSGRHTRFYSADQIDKIVNTLEPTGIVVYGSAPNEIFVITRLKGIPIFQYDSFIMKENKKDRERKLCEAK